MTITRAPTGAELQCAICRSPNDIDIDHIQNRGAGGSKERDVWENKIPLCRGHHTAKTVGTIKTWVKDGVYHWRKRDSDLVFRVPVVISERYGCLVPMEANDVEPFTAERIDAASIRGEMASGGRTQLSGGNTRGAEANSSVGSIHGDNESRQSGTPVNLLAIACDGAELQSNAGGPGQQGSAPSQAGEGEDAANAREIRASNPSPAASAGDHQRVTPPGGLAGKRSPALAGAGGESGSVPPTPVSPGFSPALLVDAEGDRAQPAGLGPVNATPSAFSLDSWLGEGERLYKLGLDLKQWTDEWRFEMGDWLARGEGALGEVAYGYFSRFEDKFGPSHLRALRWVSASVSRELQELAPSWSHARAVAVLPEKAQRAALITAREEGLSSRDLAALVRQDEPTETHSCPLCGAIHKVKA